MKKITAYVNTLRVHWLVEGLEALGVGEIMVTEYFSPTSRISRMELIAHDEDVAAVRDVVHRQGTLGLAGDHAFFVEDYDPTLPDQIPLGKRTSKLEESRAKQLISFTLHGTHTKIRAAFLLLTLCIVVAGMFIYFRTDSFRQATLDTMTRIRLSSESGASIESALLEEMLAVERLHRGEASDALRDFQTARANLQSAIIVLRDPSIGAMPWVDSLSILEHEFNRIAGGMFGIIDSLTQYERSGSNRKTRELSISHARFMASLDQLRLQLLELLGALQVESRKLVEQKQAELLGLTRQVMIFLLLLGSAAIVTTVTIWFLIERTVARPIQKLMEEAKHIDHGRVS